MPIYVAREGSCCGVLMAGGICSDYSGTNAKLPKILLNGNNICMVRQWNRCRWLGRKD